MLLLAEWARSVSLLRLLRWKVAGDFDEHQSSTAQRVGHEHSLPYVQQVDCKDGLATPRTAEILRCGFIIDVHRFALCRSAGPVIFRIPRLSDPPRWRMARRPGGPPVRSPDNRGRGHRLSVSRPRRRPQLSSGSATPSGTPRMLMSDEGFLSVDMHVCPGSPVFSNFLPTPNSLHESFLRLDFIENITRTGPRARGGTMTG